MEPGAPRSGAGERMRLGGSRTAPRPLKTTLRLSNRVYDIYHIAFRSCGVLRGSLGARGAAASPGAPEGGGPSGPLLCSRRPVAPPAWRLQPRARVFVCAWVRGRACGDGGAQGERASERGDEALSLVLRAGTAPHAVTHAWTLTCMCPRDFLTRVKYIYVLKIDVYSTVFQEFTCGTMCLLLLRKTLGWEW